MIGRCLLSDSAGRRLSARRAPAINRSTRGAQPSSTNRILCAEQRWPRSGRRTRPHRRPPARAARRVNDHGVDAAGFGDERNDRPSRAARAALIRFAVSTEPVKAMPAMRGSATSGAPTVSPSPMRRSQRPSGCPRRAGARSPQAQFEVSAPRALRSRVVAGSECRATWPVKMASGKFQG